jgi:hypothetical protein
VHIEEEAEPEAESEVEEEEEATDKEVENPKSKISQLQKVAEVSPPPAAPKKCALRKPKEKTIMDEKPAPKAAEPKPVKRKASLSPSPSDPSTKESKAEKLPAKPKTPKSKPVKRKRCPSPPSDEAPAQKLRKHKSSATITDSDDEADYDLPAAPALELPEQREGWEFTEALSEEIEGSVRVMQTDKKKGSKVRGVVVEQGTTIVKRVESEKAGPEPVQKEELAEREKSSSVAAVEEVEPATEQVEDKTSYAQSVSERDEDDDLPAPQSSCPSVSSAMKKRKTSFDGEEKPAKKAKKVSFEEDVVDVKRKRKVSIEYMIDEGEEDEERVVQDEATSEDSGAEVEVVEAAEDD